MEKCFDAFLYVANWGTHEVMLRLPKTVMKRGEWAPFCAGDSLRAWVKADHIILRFRAEEVEADEEEDGEGWLDSLLPVRTEILRGDLRALYLGWLVAVEVDDDEPEPPLPAGLRDLSKPLRSLTEFLDIDSNLLDSAAQLSADLETAVPSTDLLARWIAGLPEKEKNALLLQVALGENPHAGVDLMHRFRLGRATDVPGPAAAPGTRRTAGQLRLDAERHAQEKQRRVAERKRLERDRETQQKAARRAKYLEDLENREPESWQQSESLIGTKRPNDYDRAVDLLKDLRDLAERKGRSVAFKERLLGLTQRHAAKSSFLERVRKAGLA